MKAFIFSNVLFLLTATVFSQSSSLNMQDSTHQYRWENGGWLGERRNIFTYDATGKKTTDVLKMPDFNDPATWMVYSRNRYDYTHFDSLQTRTEEVWSEWGQTWMTISRERHTYTIAGKPDSVVSEYFDGVTWTPQWETSHEYNATHQLTRETRLDFSMGAIWQGHQQIFTYTGAGQIDTLTVMTWDTAAGTWKYVNRMVHQYLPTGKLTKILNFDTDSATQAWILTSETVHSYSASGLLTARTTREDMGSGIMVDIQRVMYSYDAQGLLLQETYQFPNFFGGGWLTTNEIVYTYDPEGFLIRQVVRGMNFTGGLSLENSARTDFFWNARTSTDIDGKTGGTIGLVVANPARPGAVIRVETSLLPAVLTLTDLNGRVLMQQTLSGAEVHLPESLTPGVYLIRAEAGTQPTAATKIVVAE